MLNVPFAIIGGSSTFSISFPEDLNEPGVEIISKNKVYSTPFGKSPAMTVFSINGKKAVTCRMHGWMNDRPRADSSRQIFWVFREMGVNKVITEGGVGAILTKMKPGDIFIPDDYIDFSLRKDVKLGDEYLLVMRDPVCADIRESMLRVIRKKPGCGIFKKGAYAVTDGKHFESRAEVRALKKMGADAVGQSFCPEVYLAREIGACFCGIYLVVNMAEGIVQEWDYDKFKHLFYTESKNIGRVLIETLKTLDVNADKCGCGRLRIKTLLNHNNAEK